MSQRPPRTAPPVVRGSPAAVAAASRLVLRRWTRRRPAGPVCFRESDKPVSKAVEQNVAKATSKVSHTMTGFLSDPATQAQAYWTLASVASATAATALLLPGQFAGAAFGAAPDSVVQSAVRAAGATLITSATVKFTLKEAALRGQLHMETFQRLNLGLMLQSFTCLVVLAQAISLRSPVLTAIVGGICGAGLLLSGRIYALNKTGLPFPSAKKALSGAVSVLMPRNLPAAAYSLLTITLAGMAAMSLGAAPGQPMALYDGLMGAMTVFMQRVVGGGLLLMTLVAYSLKDGADREKLGATTFRWLNLGLAGSLMAMFICMAIDLQAGRMAGSWKSSTMLATQAAAFMWTSFMYIAGTSKPKTGTSAAARGKSE